MGTLQRACRREDRSLVQDWSSLPLERSHQQASMQTLPALSSPRLGRAGNLLDLGRLTTQRSESKEGKCRNTRACDQVSGS